MGKWATGDPVMNEAILASLADHHAGGELIQNYVTDGIAGNKAIGGGLDASQTSTAWSVIAAMIGTTIYAANASATTVTLTKDVTSPVPVGGVVVVIQGGAGLITFAAESGATIVKIAATLKSNGRYSRIVCTKVAANTWAINGDLSAT